MSIQLHILLHPDIDTALIELAKSNGITKTEQVIRLINKEIEDKKKVAQPKSNSLNLSSLGNIYKEASTTTTGIDPIAELTKFKDAIEPSKDWDRLRQIISLLRDLASEIDAKTRIVVQLRPTTTFNKEWEEVMKKARERKRKEDEEYYRQKAEEEAAAKESEVTSDDEKVVTSNDETIVSNEESQVSDDGEKVVQD